jgi:hypothetical protein
MNKKGQAAMEFLMTYGWAILAAIIAIGVLAYFGVFNPGRFVQDSIFIAAPLGGNAQQVNSSAVTLDIQNGAGERINITTVTVGSCPIYTYGQYVTAESNAVISVPCTLTSGDTFRGDITIKYLRQSTTLESKTTGTITAKVQ